MILIFIFTNMIISETADINKSNYTHLLDTINVPQGISPVIDGTISSGEWDDAYMINYQAGLPGNIITVTCYLKHNGTDTFYIAQNMPNTLSGDRNLVWLDTQNNGGTSPQTDDYMLNKYHMDGSPTIEEKGTGSSWNMVAQNGWIVELTGYDWNSDVGQIEFAVAFSKLGITTGVQKTIGFGIAFGERTIPYNPSKIWSWPLNSDLLNPDSWGDLIFFGPQTNINEQLVMNNCKLHQNYPNPFNPSTTIKYFVEKPCNVRIKIYNQLGQEICILSDKQMNAGEHSVTWDGKNNSGQRVSTGIYFYQINIGKNFSEIRKMLMIK